VPCRWRSLVGDFLSGISTRRFFGANDWLAGRWLNNYEKILLGLCCRSSRLCRVACVPVFVECVNRPRRFGATQYDGGCDWIITRNISYGYCCRFVSLVPCRLAFTGRFEWVLFLTAQIFGATHDEGRAVMWIVRNTYTIITHLGLLRTFTRLRCRVAWRFTGLFEWWHSTADSGCSAWWPEGGIELVHEKIILRLFAAFTSVKCVSHAFTGLLLSVYCRRADFWWSAWYEEIGDW